MGSLLAAVHVALQSAELLLRPLQLRPQRLVGQPQLGVLRLRLQLLCGPGLQLLLQLGSRGRIEAGEDPPSSPGLLVCPRLPTSPRLGILWHRVPQGYQRVQGDDGDGGPGWAGLHPVAAEWAGGRSPPAAAASRVLAPARGSAAPAPDSLATPPGGGPGTHRGHLSLRGPQSGRGQRRQSPATPASGIGPGGGGAAGPPDSAGAGAAREAAALSPRTDTAPPARARSPAFEGPGVTLLLRTYQHYMPQPQPLPPPGAPSRSPALTAATPALGRPVLGPPPPGRPTHASERPRRSPAARAARAAAGSRASAPPAAWRGEQGLKTKRGLPALPEGDPCSPGQAKHVPRMQSVPLLGAHAPA